MQAELTERFTIASEEQIDKVDFYSDLLDCGITVEMVCKYMGNEKVEQLNMA